MGAKTPRQMQNLDQRLEVWLAAHPDVASLRAAYRARVLDFALNSMALEGDLVDREQVRALLKRPIR